MPIVKTNEQVDKIRRSCRLVGHCLHTLKEFIREGVSLLQIDKFVYDLIKSKGAEPGFLGFNDYPKSVCASVNEAVIHQIPNDYRLKAGDIVGVDIGVLIDGYYGDAAYTYPIGDVDDKVKELMKTTEEALYKGIEQAIAGNKLYDISAAVQKHVEDRGFSVVKEYVGHGIGSSLWEPPPVPNYGNPNTGQPLYENMVIAIEPMVNIGTDEVELLSDKWTVVTKDRQYSAHYEHTICIKNGKPEILTIHN